MKKKIKGLIFFLLLYCSYASAEPLNIIYPNVNQQGDKSLGYAALKLALDNSGVEYKITLTKEQATNQRSIYLINKGDLSIADFGTSKEYEQELLPIYFPIDLGMNGYRQCVIHKNNESKLQKVKTIEDLRELSFLQGTGWSDVELLEHSGLKVHTVSKIEKMLKMIAHERMDCFPLGVNEIDYILKSDRF